MNNERQIFPETAPVALPDTAFTDPIDDFDDEPAATDGLRPLPFPERFLPSPLREVVTNAPANRKAETLKIGNATLQSIPERARVAYPYDRVLHALTSQTIVEAAPSTGKGFVDDIVRLFIGPTLLERDTEQRLIEQEYREKKASRKANEKIGGAPKTTIRCIPPATSKTVILKRADTYKRVLGDYPVLFLWCAELRQAIDAGKMSFSDLSTLMRNAYDLGSMFGQDFASDNSYSAIADVNIVSVFCATPFDVDEYMSRKCIMGGNVTRTILIQLDDGLGSAPAVFRPVTPEQQASIDQTLEQLMATTYTDDETLKPTFRLPMDWLYKDVRKWCQEKADEALRSGDTALDVFRKRSSVSAYRATALLYLLYLLEQGVDIHRYCEGGEPLSEKTLARIHKLCRKFYEWMAGHVLQPMLTRWGARYNEMLQKREEGSNPDRQKPLFDQLTTVFTRQQLDTLIRENCRQSESRFYLFRWKAKGWIEKIDKNQFRKLV